MNSWDFGNGLARGLGLVGAPGTIEARGTDFTVTLLPVVGALSSSTATFDFLALARLRGSVPKLHFFFILAQRRQRSFLIFWRQSRWPSALHPSHCGTQCQQDNPVQHEVLTRWSPNSTVSLGLGMASCARRSTSRNFLRSACV